MPESELNFLFLRYKLKCLLTKCYFQVWFFPLLLCEIDQNMESAGMEFCMINANLMNFVNPGGPHFSPLRQSCRPPIMDKPTFVMNPKPSYFVRNPILT